MAGSLLAVLPPVGDARPLFALAASHGWDLTVVHDPAEALSKVGARTFPVILLDRDVQEDDWRNWVRSFAQLRPTPSVILISSVSDHYLFEELVKQGGFDVIAKPLAADELQRVTRLAFAFWKNRWLSR